MLGLFKTRYCLGVSIAALKHHDQKSSWGMKGLFYTSALLVITEGSQDKNTNRAGSQRQELIQKP